MSEFELWELSMALRTLLLLRHSNTTLTLTLITSRSCLRRTTPSSPFSSSSGCRRRSHPWEPPQAPPPCPKKVPFRVSVHGKTWEDPYHWMSNADDPNLLEHLRRENCYAEAFTADTLELRSKLASEMKRRIPATVSTPLERWGPWFVHLLYYPHCFVYTQLNNIWYLFFFLEWRLSFAVAVVW